MENKLKNTPTDRKMYLQVTPNQGTLINIDFVCHAISIKYSLEFYNSVFHSIYTIHTLSSYIITILTNIKI